MVSSNSPRSWRTLGWTRGSTCRYGHAEQPCGLSHPSWRGRTGVKAGVLSAACCATTLAASLALQCGCRCLLQAPQASCSSLWEPAARQSITLLVANGQGLQGSHGLWGSWGSLEPAMGWCSCCASTSGNTAAAAATVSAPPQASLAVCLSQGGCQGSCHFPRQGVQVDAQGHTVVNDYQNTTSRGVYAIRDICGRALLTPGTVAVPPARSPSSPCCAVAQAPRPSPQWQSQPAGSWHTGSSRASRTLSWTTMVTPTSFSATRPSAPWSLSKVGAGTAWGAAAQGKRVRTWWLRAAGLMLEETI